MFNPFDATGTDTSQYNQAINTHAPARRNSTRAFKFPGAAEYNFRFTLASKGLNYLHFYWNQFLDPQNF